MLFKKNKNNIKRQAEMKKEINSRKKIKKEKYNKPKR